jgi:hypothetical protein
MIERTGAWLDGFRRRRIRHERSSERFYALAMLACAVICFQHALSATMVTFDLARRAQDRVLEDGVGMDGKLTLPAFREEDLEFLDRLDTRSSGPG